jgi:hypothetical protein
VISIPPALQAEFVALLQSMAIPNNAYAPYLKWLRYYWDFCRKYRLPPTERDSLPRFLTKLQEKKQSQAQTQQAFQAVTLYYQPVNQGELRNQVASPRAAITPGSAPNEPYPPAGPSPKQTASSITSGSLPNALAEELRPPASSPQGRNLSKELPGRRSMPA